MGDRTGEHIEFDVVNDRAWQAFRGRLADHLAEMVDGDVLVVDADPADETTGGAAPYVRFCASGEEAGLRGEVVSNAYLAPEHRLDARAAGVLLAMGWRAPTRSPEDRPDSGSTNFFVDTEPNGADRLAVMAVRVLREVFAVVHPAFLGADGLEVEPGPAERECEEDAEPGPSEPLAEMPRDREELQALVDAALTPYFGHPPRKDADGDIPVVTDSTVVFVRVLEEAPIVHLFCQVVGEVDDVEAARFETGVLNRDGRFVRFSVVGDAVMAEIDLPALPFAPAQLRDLLGVLCSRADDVVADLVARVGGRPTLDPGDAPEPDDLVAADEGGDDDLDDDLYGEATDDADPDAEADTDPVHPAMQTLLELDADRPGSVTPELAASICAWDRDLVLELVGWNSRQEIAWRQARDRAETAGDDDEAGVCEGERAHAEGSVALLRQALRLVVEAQLARHRAVPGHPDRGRRASSRGRGADASLPGLEPRQDPQLFEGRPSGREQGRG